MRIQRLLSLLERIWCHYPDLRFNQLIYNLQSEYSKQNSDTGKVVKEGEAGMDMIAFDLFHVEDDAFIEFLRKYLDNLK